MLDVVEIEIPVKVFSGGGIDCLSQSCPFRSECSCHTTAGEFRMEGGFTPEISTVDGFFFCKTQTEEIDRSIEYADLPKKQLGQGYLIFQDGKIQYPKEEL
jgi:hypothetical protein